MNIQATTWGRPARWLRPPPARGTATQAIALRDGRQVVVRPVAPQDALLQRDFLRRLSPESRYRRFHGAITELPEATLRYLTEVDQRDHVALLAEDVARPEHPRQVAEARFVRRAEETGDADIAIAVADDWQGNGLGSLLLQTLGRLAGDAAVARLNADVLAENRPMRELLLRLGWRIRPDPHDARLVVATLELGPPPSPRAAARRSPPPVSTSTAAAHAAMAAAFVPS
jgi:GNAT superfamily N-acetyltransferase